ncbi:MAG: HAD family phosphatase [Lachnospiraceae bacterium]|nr:HAD family phosphatase [Lachnospiraceae bacterium]
MVNTVVFDIGMVLVYFRWRELFSQLGFEGEKFETIAKATVQNPWWNEFDKGNISVEEIEEKYILSAPEYREDIKQIYQHADEFVEMYDYTYSWIRDLKTRGYKVYVLSNWSEIAYEKNKDTHLKFLEEMDGGILSFREGLIKPDKRIYQLLCERYQINPLEAVFLDDNLANVKAAIEYGMHGIHFVEESQAKQELEKYLK